MCAVACTAHAVGFKDGDALDQRGHSVAGVLHVRLYSGAAVNVSNQLHDVCIPVHFWRNGMIETYIMQRLLKTGLLTVKSI
jgi:hypothetical protein